MTITPRKKALLLLDHGHGMVTVFPGWGLIGGNIFHGELSTNQLLHMRPAPGFANYRTPIKGLYQACGVQE